MVDSNTGCHQSHDDEKSRQVAGLESIRFIAAGPPAQVESSQFGGYGNSVDLLHRGYHQRNAERQDHADLLEDILRVKGHASGGLCLHNARHLLCEQGDKPNGGSRCV